MNNIELLDSLEPELLAVLNKFKTVNIELFNGIKVLVINNGTNSECFELSNYCPNLYELCLRNNISIVAREETRFKNLYKYYHILNENFSKRIDFDDENILKKFIRESKIKSIIND